MQGQGLFMKRLRKQAPKAPTDVVELIRPCLIRWDRITTGEHGGCTRHGFAYENISILDTMCQDTCAFTHFLEVALKLHKIIHFDYKMKEHCESTYGTRVGEPPHIFYKWLQANFLGFLFMGVGTPMNRGVAQGVHGGHGGQIHGGTPPHEPVVCRVAIKMSISRLCMESFVFRYASQVHRNLKKSI